MEKLIHGKVIIVCEDNYLRKSIELLSPFSTNEFIKTDEVISPIHRASTFNIFAILSERNTCASLRYIFKIHSMFHHTCIHFISLKQQPYVIKRAVECTGGTYNEVGFEFSEFQKAMLHYISGTHTDIYNASNIITPLEAEILALYLNNFSRKSIALGMGCAPKTVHNHILNALKKMNLTRSRDLFT
ncbi:helix-turn-helix transcriptional regulator [Klebsiella quasipneumoniae]|uniref:helix-turn-helix transcriptional regulator n=1 Tax=Klebsiella quasipneumoniae TaxID=1463165 RepID=UPI0022E991CD|nr:LuxR C-terminal-related transcriptional regulator [Klebsiella quasipneumoniae]